MKNVKIVMVIVLLVSTMLLSSIVTFASTTKIVENVFTGEGYITHEDQEVSGLSFNMFFENNGLTYVRVSGEESNIDAWRSRTSGRFVSDSEMDSIMNPEPVVEEEVIAQEPVVEEAPEVIIEEPVVEEAPEVIIEEPVVEEAIATPEVINESEPEVINVPSTPVVNTPTVQQPHDTDYIEVRSLPEGSITKIIKNVYTGSGYITHEDQEVDLLEFDMYLEHDGITYVYVSGPESKVEAWRVRTNGTYVTEDALDEAELLGGEILETSIRTDDVEVSIEEDLEDIIFDEIVEEELLELALTSSIKNIELQWTEPSNTNGLLGYLIYKRVGSDEYPMSDFPIKAKSFTDKKVEIGVDYSYIVEAVFKNSKVSKSNEVSGSIKAKKAITLKINNDKIKVNGKERKIDNTQATPIIVEGRTMVPIRAIVEELDGVISWDGNERKIMIGVNDKIVELWIDRSEFKVNGKSKNFDVPPMILNGRTLIPLRFVAESIGCEVEWDAVTQSVSLYN